MGAINSEVPITIAKRPPLELTHRLSVLRCHAQFQDRGSIVDSLRHGARPVQHEQGSDNPMLQAPEFRHRQYLYSLLRGGAMHPLCHTRLKTIPLWLKLLHRLTWHDMLNKS